MTVESAISALSPKHWYKLDETSGTTATDSGSGGVNGTYAGSPSLAQSSTGAPDGDNFVDFDGVDDRVDVGTTSTFANAHKTDVDASIVLFYKLSSALGDERQALFGQTGLSIATVGVQAEIDNRSALTGSGKDNAPYLRFWAADGTAYSTNETLPHLTMPIASDTNWHMYAMLKDSSDYKVYQDNVLIAATTPYAGNPTTATSTNAMDIGDYGSATANSFNGLMAHFAYWESVLTEAQLTTIWKPFVEGGGAGAGTGTLNLILTDEFGNPIPNLSGLRWIYYHDDPATFTTAPSTPVASGTGASTDANGLFSVSSITGLGVSSGNGYIVITDSDGNPYNQENSTSKAVTLT